jgi:hypothetical protein
MKVTEENREELLKEYIQDIYWAMTNAIPHYKPSLETIERMPHSSLVTQYALTLEFLYRVRQNSSILLSILNNESFKPHNLEEFSKNFEKLAEKCREREYQEYLEKEARRKRFVQWRREAAEARKKTSNEY